MKVTEWVLVTCTLILSTESRRTLRTATLPSSLMILACLHSSLRRSSVNGGTLMRITPDPSLVGVRFKSLVLMAFSISFTSDLSNGSTTSCCAPDVATRATCPSGVGVPYWSTNTRSNIAGLAPPARNVFICV